VVINISTVPTTTGLSLNSGSSVDNSGVGSATRFPRRLPTYQPFHGRTVAIREDFHIKQVSQAELWRLSYRFLGESEVEAMAQRGSDRLRIALRRLRLVQDELKLRGVQLELDLREREQKPAHGHIRS
jgi:hypothetical protein